MKVEFFCTETGQKRATYNLNDSKWPELEDLMNFVKRLMPLERASYAVFRFNGSVYSICREEEVYESSTCEQ